MATFQRCVAELGEDLDLLGGRSGGLLMAAHVLDGLDDGGADRQPLARWVRQTIDEIWHTIDGWAPVGWCAELPHLGLAHGWAGLLYATLHACRATRTPSPPGLVARLDELAGLAQPYGRGVRWTGSVPQLAAAARTPPLAPGWCSGTGGHTLLWTLASTELADPRHLALAERAGWYAVEHPATDPDLCCGTTGRALALLALYQATGATRWLVESRRLAEVAARSWDGDPRLGTLRGGALGTAWLLLALEAPERATFPVLS